MDTFLIDVPVPSMGATVNELTVISLKIGPGARVSKGQKIAELESDKSVFEFESPCDGSVKAIFANAGDVKPAGAPFLRIETADVSLKHLTAAPSAAPEAEPAAKPAPPPSPGPARLLWTPKALKLAQQAGLDTSITDIEATGPGNRVTGDDVTRYLARPK
jgi:pyruvate/2-oxoglutarate dehydrogenase complex dihydrolipoamide acyltransferase (E2) component